MIQGNGKLLVVQCAPTWLYLRHQIPGSRQAWLLEMESQAFERWASSQGIYNDSQIAVIYTGYDATHLWRAFQHQGDL